MSIRSEEFTVTGLTTVPVNDSGIQSVAGQAPKRLIRIELKVSAYNGAIIKCFEGQTQMQGDYDYSFSGYVAIASMTPANTSHKTGFEVDKVLEVGNPYFIQVGNATTATVVYGSYVYEQDD